MSGFNPGNLASEVLGEWRAKSKNALYRSDPEAWIYDVLGSRWHSKQQEVGHAFIKNPRVMVKSGNGSGKSRQVGEIISWAIAVHEIGEVLCICSAPTLRQVEEVTFSYLGQNYQTAKSNGFALPGTIGDALKWTYRDSPRSKAQTLVLGMKPSDRDTVSTFQGIRAQGIAGELEIPGKTWVLLDEAGGVPSDLFVAAESVTTGGGVDGNKIGGIGNPDRLGTEFHSIFTDPKKAQDWSLHTISVFDLPTVTGEVVYPGEPEKQAKMLKSGMNDMAWIEHKQRAWGIESARYQSKVLGQFPDADDRSFFSQTAIDRAKNTEIMLDREQYSSLGVDVARFGEDDSMAYLNVGGHIRIKDKWSKATTNQSASTIHRLAVEEGAHQVVIDAAGLGAGIADQVEAMSDTSASRYMLIKTLGAYASPDPTRYLNARAYWYDKFREAMMFEQIDLDPSDEQLMGELLIIQFDYTPKGQIKIESKQDMAKRGIKSPDAIDAVIYSFITTELMDAASAMGMKRGDVGFVDPADVLLQLQDDMSWLPI